jgi:molybdenum cofactor synthesis domain-containing protein
MNVGVLTISSAGARGERADGSGDAIVAWIAARGYTLAARTLVSDDVVQIVNTLTRWCDGGECDLVLTTGGTGLSPTDVTPEATRVVLERDAPGIAERIRTLSLTSFPRAALSRGVSGTRARTLIVNLPGSTSGVSDSLAALEPIIDHAIGILRGEATDHSSGTGPAPRAPRPESRAPSPAPRAPRT